MLNVELGQRNGFDHRPDTLVLAGMTTLRPFASYEASLGFKTTAAAETKTENCKKGEIQWTITTIPLAKRRTDSRKVDLELQRA
jgi:hypothetical protein